MLGAAAGTISPSEARLAGSFAAASRIRPRTSASLFRPSNHPGRTKRKNRATILGAPRRQKQAAACGQPTPLVRLLRLLTSSSMSSAAGSEDGDPDEMRRRLARCDLRDALHGSVVCCHCRVKHDVMRAAPCVVLWAPSLTASYRRC